MQRQTVCAKAKKVYGIKNAQKCTPSATQSVMVNHIKNTCMVAQAVSCTIMTTFAAKNLAGGGLHYIAIMTIQGSTFGHSLCPNCFDPNISQVLKSGYVHSELPHTK
jgi:hypothetical protein